MVQTFASALGEAVGRIGETQQVIADKTGVPQPMIGRFLRGVQPTVPTIQKLAVGMGVDIVFTADGEIKFIDTKVEVQVYGGT